MKWTGFRRAALAVVIALGASACHDPDAYTLSPGRIEQILSVTPSALALPADGVTRMTITAQIDPRADEDKRFVTFTTTGGTLVWGYQEGLATTVPSDESGKAVIELRSGTTPGIVRVQVRVGDISRSLEIAFTAVQREALFTVDVSRTAIPADGFSTARITLTLRRPGTVQQRVVTFESSGGSLLATGVSPARRATVTAATNGVAVVDLQSDKTVGPVRLAITALERTETIELSFVPVATADIITLSVSPRDAPADGATPLAIVARVAAGLPAGRRSVTFGTTIGQFLPGRRDEFTIEADGSHEARATLVSTTVGEGRLTATVDGTTVDANVEFTVARPDSLFVSAAAGELRTGESTLVTVTLRRDVGAVSPQLEVRYTAVKSNGGAIGTFSGVTLGNQGVSTATFNVGSTTYVGPVTIKASVSGVSASATLEIVP